jgi:hypothetical protein
MKINQKKIFLSRDSFSRFQTHLSLKGDKSPIKKEKNMKLQQIINDKFSILLIMAIVFIALPVVAAAQGEGRKVTIAFCKTDKTYAGGIRVAVGDLNSDAAALNQIYLSRISLLTGAFDGGVGVVDSCDPDAASKIKMLFEVRSTLRLTNDVVIDILKDNTRESFEMMNYLRQAQASGTKIPVMELVAGGSGNQEIYLTIELKDVYITSYQTGTGATTVDSLSVNFTAIKFEYKPNNDKDKE